MKQLKNYVGKIIVSLSLLASSLSYISAQERSDVPFAEAREEFLRIRLLAENGDSDAAVMLWKSGSLIDKNEILRDVASRDNRLALIKKAADSGQPEACFIYAMEILYQDNTDLKDFRKLLAQSCKGKYIVACTLELLIEKYYENNTTRTRDILSQLGKIVPEDPENIFDTSITLESIKFVTESIEGKGLPWLRNKANEEKESQLLDCIAIFDYYVKLSTSDERPQTIKQTLDQAESGNSEAAVGLWKMGTTIDNAPKGLGLPSPAKRLALLKQAADSGHPEASYIYFVDRLKGGQDSQILLKYLRQSSEGKYTDGVIAYAIILGFNKGRFEEARKILATIKEQVSKFKKDIFDTSTLASTYELIEKSLKEQDVSIIRMGEEDTAEKYSQLQLFVEILDKYEIKRD